MRSVQGRLIVAITGTSVVLLLIAGALLYRTIRRGLDAEFDRTLAAQAAALSSLVTIDEEAKVEFEYGAVATAKSNAVDTYRAEYYVIRHKDGRLFAAGAPMTDGGGGRGAADASSHAAAATAPASAPSNAWAAQLDLPAAARHRAQDVTLPDGRPGRALRLDFPAHAEANVSPAIAASAPHFYIVVARDTAGHRVALREIARAIGITAAAVIAAIAIAVGVIVRRSLRPLRAVGERAAQIDPSHLHLRLPERSLPAELAPICARLNDLLARLDQAFARERRFTADVAHELRTPIAELRSVTEVALRWPDDAAMSREALADANAVATQMQTLINTLLSLVRADGAAPDAATGADAPADVRLVPVLLARAIDAVVAEDARTRHASRLVIDVPADAVVLAEPALLASVLRNVIDNALEHGVRKSAVHIRAAPAEDGSRWMVAVENEVTGLTPADVAHVFEPFWRKDAARSDARHAGLGLALVKAYCALLRGDVRAALREPDTFRVEIALPAATGKSNPPPNMPYPETVAWSV